MPLRDHFHPPLSEQRLWQSFHSYWSTAIGRRLNRRGLPEPYVADVQVHFGGVEIDVATFRPSGQPIFRNGQGGLATATVTTPIAEHVLEAVFPDDVEVRIFETEGGLSLVGAIELVSLSNKDRPESCRAFAAKCAAYLQAGVGVMIVDVVTNRTANLHDHLMEQMNQPETTHFPDDVQIYSSSYRPNRWQAAEGQPIQNQIDAKLYRLDIGQALPVIPLTLRRGPTISVDLESTYMEACEDMGL